MAKAYYRGELYYADLGKGIGSEQEGLFVRKVQHKYSEYCLREERYWQTHRDTTHYTPRAVPISPNEYIANEALPNDSTQNILAQLWR